VFDSPTEWAKAFDEVARRGVWFELGERRDLPGAAPWVGSQALARDACALFRALLPLYDRLAGHVEARAGGFEG
jgi:hypothetical protein